MSNPIDPYQYTAASPLRIPDRFYAITPSDTENLPEFISVIRANSGGNIVVAPADESLPPVLFVVDSGGVIEMGRIRRVLATGTTASGLVGAP